MSATGIHTGSTSAPAGRAASALTVWVTGASGLLGTALCRRLAGQGHRVVPQGRTGATGFSLESLARIEPAVREARPDWIIHAAANTNLDACEADPVAAWRLHVDASREIARVAARCGSRLLYVSTDAVYDGEGAGAHTETAATKPRNHYARTKLAGEQACRETLATTIIARVNFVGLLPTRRQGLAAWLMENLRAGRAVTGFTDVRFNPLEASALAVLLIAAMEASLPGGIYNFGTEDACSKFDFARRLAERMGVDASLVRPGTLAGAVLPTVRPRNTVMDVRKLSAALAQPLPTVADGIARLVAG